jgi:hypothetical protein
MYVTIIQEAIHTILVSVNSGDQLYVLPLRTGLTRYLVLLIAGNWLPLVSSAILISLVCNKLNICIAPAIPTLFYASSLCKLLYYDLTVYRL